MGRQAVAIVTDPGPDPDDCKALLVAAAAHRRGEIGIACVIANGGGQPLGRARLARCILDRVGLGAVPVGVGSQGKPYDAMPHEYVIEGYDRVDPSTLLEGTALLRETIAEHGKLWRRSLHVVCISSLRDVADAIAADEEAFMRAVCHVSIQGGVVPDDDAPLGWRADLTAVNCRFDEEAADAVVRFCLSRGLPMTVCSRNATPMLSMQLARSYAIRTEDALMRYLADAQFLGLSGLWRKLCEGKLPARCTKEWYFETFCGVPPASFAARGLRKLGRESDIIPYLDGYVKPYDVLAVMAVLPTTHGAIKECGTAEGTPAPHQFLLAPEQAVDAAHVANVLRNAFRAAVEAADLTLRGTREPHPRSLPSPRRRRTLFAHLRRRSPVQPIPTTPGSRSSDAHDTITREKGGQGRGVDGTFRPSVTDEELQHELSQCLEAARVNQESVSRITLGIGMVIIGASVCIVLVVNARMGEQSPAEYQKRQAILVMAMTVGVCLVLSSHFPVQAHRRRIAASAPLGVVAILAAAYVVWRELHAVVKSAAISLTPVQIVRICGYTFSMFTAIICATAVAVVSCTLHTKPAVLLQRLWILSGIMNMFFGIGVSIGRLAGNDLTSPQMRWVIASRVLVISSGVVMLVPGARAFWHRVLARTLAAKDQRTAIAALLGFGTVDVWDADTPVRHARSVFAPVYLDDDNLRNLAVFWRRAVVPHRTASAQSLTELASSPEGTSESYHPSRSSGRMRAVVVQALGCTSHAFDSTSRECSDKGRDTEAHGRGAGRDQPDETQSRPKMHVASSTGALETHPEVADWFIVNSYLDPWPGRHKALSVAVRAFESIHGRRPTAWVAELCGDPGLSPEELLSHMPFNMARSTRLLLIAGPQLPSDMGAVAALFCWRLLGRGADKEETSATVADHGPEAIAALDSFHVGQATSLRTLHGMWSMADAEGAAAILARVSYAMMSAGVSFVEGAVHAFAPVVKVATAAKTQTEGEIALRFID